MIPGSFHDLQNRLSNRMTESTTQMELRLKTAADELEQASLFDCLVVNADDKLDRAVADIDAAITAEKQKKDRVPMRLL
jgi:guanylate kinase